jgi:hypothetical protein
MQLGMGPLIASGFFERQMARVLKKSFDQYRNAGNVLHKLLLSGALAESIKSLTGRENTRP